MSSGSFDLALVDIRIKDEDGIDFISSAKAVIRTAGSSYSLRHQTRGISIAL